MEVHDQEILIRPLTCHPREGWENKQGWIDLDQIRTVDRRRLIKKLGKISLKEIEKVKSTIQEMLVD